MRPTSCERIKFRLDQLWWRGGRVCVIGHTFVTVIKSVPIDLQLSIRNRLFWKRLIHSLRIPGTKYNRNIKTKDMRTMTFNGELQRRRTDASKKPTAPAHGRVSRKFQHRRVVVISDKISWLPSTHIQQLWYLATHFVLLSFSYYFAFVFVFPILFLEMEKGHIFISILFSYPNVSLFSQYRHFSVDDLLFSIFITVFWNLNHNSRETFLR